MKLLFDANLSPRLVQFLSDLFPDSAHVEDFANLDANDDEIWDYALRYGFVIVTKDADFNDMSRLAKESPKIIWIRRGNCSTSIIEHILRSNTESIISLANEANELSVLILF
jgi:predicted nuclease of predicted toxin-antitoxin system